MVVVSDGPHVAATRYVVVAVAVNTSVVTPRGTPDTDVISGVAPALEFVTLMFELLVTAIVSTETQ
jgi:hypothetical protein